MSIDPYDYTPAVWQRFLARTALGWTTNQQLHRLHRWTLRVAVVLWVGTAVPWTLHPLAGAATAMLALAVFFGFGSLVIWEQNRRRWVRYDWTPPTHRFGLWKRGLAPHPNEDR